MKSATDNALINFTTNLCFIVVSAVMTFLMTPYLIGNLGVDAYGVIQLFTSVLGYTALITTVLSSSMARFVSISYFRNDVKQANVYLSSAFWGLLVISMIILVSALVFSMFMHNVFKLPEGLEQQTRWLFLLVVASSLVATLNGLYSRSFFILNRFYWLDIFRIISTVFNVVFIVFVFNFFSKTLMVVGVAGLCSVLLTLFLTAMLDVKMLPSLGINYRCFDYTSCKEMMAMGLGVSINQLGGLLYMNSDMIVINLLLGASATGRYGVVMQCAIFIRLLSGVVTRSFGPIVMALIAKKDYEGLKIRVFMLVKLLGLILGLPICLISGFARPLLTLWVGPQFSSLDLLLILLVLGQIVPYSLGSIFAVFKGLNKLKWPGIMTMIVGISNVFLSVILVKYTKLGIYGAGIATLIAVFIKGCVFNVLYLAHLMGFNPVKVWTALIKGCIPAVIFTCIIYSIQSKFPVSAIWQLILFSAICGSLYILIVFVFVLDRADRLFAIRVTKLHKLLPKKGAFAVL